MSGAAIDSLVIKEREMEDDLAFRVSGLIKRYGEDNVRSNLDRLYPEMCRYISIIDREMPCGSTYVPEDVFEAMQYHVALLVLRTLRQQINYYRDICRKK